MHGQVSLTRHSLAADRANVFVLGAHVPVGLHVHQQHLLPRETFVAQLAVVLPLWRHVIRLVQLRVQSQTLTIAERSVAYLALERFLVRVRCLVFLVTRRRIETRSANLALVLYIVLLLMSYQTFFVVHNIVARLANVTLVSFVLSLMLLERGHLRETATAVLAYKLVVLHLHLVLLVNF